MHDAEGGDDATEDLVHVGGDKGDRKGNDELARCELETVAEFAQDRIDEEGQDKEWNENTHRDGAFDERGGTHCVLCVGNDGVDANGEGQSKGYSSTKGRPVRS